MSNILLINKGKKLLKHGDNFLKKALHPRDYFYMKIRTKTSPTHNLTIGDEYYHNSYFEYNIVNANQTYDENNFTTGNKTISVNDNITIYFRCNKDIHKKHNISKQNIFLSSYNGIESIEIGGNIMSLFYKDFENKLILDEYSLMSYMFFNLKELVSIKNLKLPATTLANYCYYNMFQGCTGLTRLPYNLLLATTLADSCYSYMFSGCTSLTRLPSRLLPATTLAANCYSNMFSGCTSLTTVPDLPATTLAANCYSNMFYNCTSLTTVPDLPATTLAEYCYNYMFSGCTSLTTVPDLPATIANPYCYYSMFSGCISLTTAYMKLTDFSNSTLSCYKMFYSCIKLSNITIAFRSFTDMNNQKNTNLRGWVTYVASSGIMNVPNTYAWTTENISYSVDGIPSGWVVNPVL